MVVVKRLLVEHGDEIHKADWAKSSFPSISSDHTSRPTLGTSGSS